MKQHESISPGSPFLPIRYVIAGVLFIVFAFLFYNLSIRLISDLEYFRANNLFKEKKCEQAIVLFEKAVSRTPNDYKKQRKLGRAYHTFSGEVAKASRAMALAQQSKDICAAALLLNENEAYTAYLLARSEQRLEQLHQHLYPDKAVPYNPLPFYRRAVFLRPNGVLYHIQMARNLYRHEKHDELLKVVRKLASNHPPVYYKVRKEKFWSDPVREAFKKGLKDAMEHEIAPRRAHEVYAAVMAAEKNWKAAISHYLKTFQYQSYQNRSGHSIHLGYLYLKDNQPGKAEEQFITALKKSGSLKKTMERIYSIYKKEKLPDSFYLLFQKVGQQFIITSETEIIVARSLMDMKKNREAEKILKEIVGREPNAGAYYWLARIAEIEKDWDKMELASQKTTVFEPDNSHFHFYFSKALKHKRKLKRAEKEAGLALKHSKKPDAGLFNHRGWIRWSQKDFLGAARDFQRAIGILPKRHYFYGYAAEAYKRAGDLDLARQYYGEALKRDPGNAGYKKKLEELKEN